MIKDLFLILIIFFILSCTIDNKNNLMKNINFSDDLSFDEFELKLEEYSKISSYPDLNE